MLTFNAHNIFRIVHKPSAFFPLNIEFKVKNQLIEDCFNNPGIYSILYKGELIYIGFSANNDDIRSTRWARQIATITLRGEKVLFSEDALDVLKNSQLWSYFAHLKPTASNKDFQTSKNRMLFASFHWEEFLILNETTLKKFEFQWNPMPNINKEEIEIKCKNLKVKFAPRCNQEYSPKKILE